MTDASRPADDARLPLASPAGRLACGADVDELLEQVAEGHGTELTAHERRCPHCQAALSELSQLWAPVQRLAAETVSVPAALKAVVAAQIRKLTADIWYTLQLAEGGAVRIAARVVARIARDAARQAPGVKVALGRSTYARIADLAEKATRRHRHPHAAVGVLGRTAVVDLAVAVQYGQELDTVARDVQQRVIAELRDKTGLRDVSVNITIDDIIP